MKVAIGSDHGGFELKNKIIESLGNSFDFIDLGCNSKESCDYPIFAKSTALKVSNKEADLGIVICTTGIGVSISANKVKGIRCALCTNINMAKMTRLHNNANVLALGANNQDLDTALEIVKTFLSTEFSNEERHIRRINLIEGDK